VVGPTRSRVRKLLVSIANAMGVTFEGTDAVGTVCQNRLGDPIICTSPLSGLTA